jgi:hypothetical protein
MLCDRTCFHPQIPPAYSGAGTCVCTWANAHMRIQNEGCRGIISVEQKHIGWQKTERSAQGRIVPRPLGCACLRKYSARVCRCMPCLRRCAFTSQKRRCMNAHCIPEVEADEPVQAGRPPCGTTSRLRGVLERQQAAVLVKSVAEGLPGRGTGWVGQQGWGAAPARRGWQMGGIPAVLLVTAPALLLTLRGVGRAGGPGAC